MDTAKLQKNAKWIDTLFKVLQKIILITMAVAICIFSILAVANAIDSDFIIGESLHKIHIGPIDITLAEGYTPTDSSILTHGWILLSLGAISAAVTYYALGCIRNILCSATLGEPFYTSVGKDIRKIGYVSIILGIVENVAGILEAQNVLYNFGVANLIDGSAISDRSIDYDLDLNFLILFAVLLLLSYIFEYGAQLQQLSDETL